MTAVGAVGLPLRRETPGPACRLALDLIWGDGGGAEDDGTEGTGKPRLRSVDSDRGPRGARRVRLLLADDEPSMRLLCRINLDLAGYEVVEAENGSEALEKPHESHFDLVLLDVMMPDLSGHEVAAHLQGDKRTRDLPIVFLSARASPSDLRRGFELGAVDYITKPFDPIALADRVEEVLERIGAGEADAYRREQIEKLGGH
jgi:CheY-like chemotaxis protein